jgi:hypothetical protein
MVKWFFAIGILLGLFSMGTFVPIVQTSTSYPSPDWTNQPTPTLIPETPYPCPLRGMGTSKACERWFNEVYYPLQTAVAIGPERQAGSFSQLNLLPTLTGRQLGKEVSLVWFQQSGGKRVEIWKNRGNVSYLIWSETNVVIGKNQITLPGLSLDERDFSKFHESGDCYRLVEKNSAKDNWQITGFSACVRASQLTYLPVVSQ